MWGIKKSFLQSNLHPFGARVTLVALFSLHTHYSEVFLFTAQRPDLQYVLHPLVNPPAPFCWLSSSGVLPNKAPNLLDCSRALKERAQNLAELVLCSTLGHSGRVGPGQEPKTGTRCGDFSPRLGRSWKDGSGRVAGLGVR